MVDETTRFFMVPRKPRYFRRSRSSRVAWFLSVASLSLTLLLQTRKRRHGPSALVAEAPLWGLTVSGGRCSEGGLENYQFRSTSADYSSPEILARPGCAVALSSGLETVSWSLERVGFRPLETPRLFSTIARVGLRSAKATLWRPGLYRATSIYADGTSTTQLLRCAYVRREIRSLSSEEKAQPI